MVSANAQQGGTRVSEIIIAAVVGLALLFSGGLVADAKAASGIRPASAGENEIVGAGHRYMLSLDEGVIVIIEGDPVLEYPEGHRIGQEQ